ncbi:hypothetical protein JTE90_010950 [Oedothorax gibbosus]|uniref:Thyroglobulin type-1 domain-containing protein n=1 Tax=Oedothorax gibbosus TaxID=931172 RepID=A0AAV6UBF0_9ARAC|nr:hypothetical protein JTE90_010950 [Oedothorax gibbosus]
MRNFVTIVVLFFSTFICLTSSNQERPCEIHRRNAGAATAPMDWDIRCDALGSYLPLQCTRESPKWCACYEVDFRITQPSRYTKVCGCYIKRYRAHHNATAGPCDIPECDRHGSFKKKQCCHATDECRCVDATTGETVTEPVPDMNLQCV